MLCDWLILTWHWPTLERAIKPLSEELIESVTQIAHIWGFNEGWNNENNIVCIGVFFPHPLNLPSCSRAPLLPNISLSLPILCFGLLKLSFFCSTANTKIALTRRKRFKTAWDASKQQRIQQSNKVSWFYLKKITFFLFFKKNRLHPIQTLVNNRL